MRASEVHAALTHYPIALLPATVGADVAGKWTGSDRLRNFARVATPVATGAAALTGASGLIAERTVDLDDETARLLEQHRTINIAAVGVTTAMTAYRATRRRPGWGYLLVGAGVLGALDYSAYLGGKMVYDHGVGVERAGGLRTEASAIPPVRTVTDAVRAAGRKIVDGVKSLFSTFGFGPDADYGPEPDELQRSIERDTDRSGALPVAGARGPQ